MFLVGEGNQENDLIFGIRQIYNDHEHFNKAKKFDVLGPNTFVIGYQKIKNRSLWLLSKKGINQAKKKAMLAINYGRTDNNEFSRDSSNEDDDDILATSNKRKASSINGATTTTTTTTTPKQKPAKKKLRKNSSNSSSSSRRTRSRKLSPVEIFADEDIWDLRRKFYCDKKSSKGIVVADLCAGSGAALLCLLRLKIKVHLYLFSEIDGDCIKVISDLCNKHNIQSRALGDVSNVTKDNLKYIMANDYKCSINLITFGSPCQDLSRVNANRTGLSKGKSSVFFDCIDFILLAKEFNKSIKEESNHPYIFMENVIPESTYLERMNRFATNACCISYKLDSRHFAPDKRNRWFATNIPFPNTFGAFNIKYSGRKKVASIKETWMKHWLSASDKDESWKQQDNNGDYIWRLTGNLTGLLSSKTSSTESSGIWCKSATAKAKEIELDAEQRGELMGYPSDHFKCLRDDTNESNKRIHKIVGNSWNIPAAMYSLQALTQIFPSFNYNIEDFPWVKYHQNEEEDDDAEDDEDDKDKNESLEY